jgi:hypothetical protein
VTARIVDELVTRRLPRALEPEEIALALAAADEHGDRRRRSNRALELRVERARNEMIRVERAFIAGEPDNRLVAQPQVGIHWQSGAAEQHTIERPKTRQEVTRTAPAAIELTGRLAATHINAQIAEQLNATGLRTTTGGPVRSRARPVDPLAAQDPLPGHLGTRRRAHRRSARRALRHLGLDRPRLDLNRRAHRPPRTRQPALHPIPAAGQSSNVAS